MKENRLGPIGQIAREVKDIRAAERWYKDVLRLPHLFTFGDLAFFDCAGTRLFLTPPESGPPKAQSVLISSSAISWGCTASSRAAE